MDKDIDSQDIAKQLLTEISNDAALCTPVYIEDITTEQEAEDRKDAPLVYLWNEDRDTGAFHLSVNGNIIDERLAKMLPQDHEQFKLIRDGIINAITQTAQTSVIKICKQLEAFPSDVFSTKKN